VTITSCMFGCGPTWALGLSALVLVMSCDSNHVTLTCNLNWVFQQQGPSRVYNEVMCDSNIYNVLEALLAYITIWFIFMSQFYENSQSCDLLWPLLFAASSAIVGGGLCNVVAYVILPRHNCSGPPIVGLQRTNALTKCIFGHLNIRACSAPRILEFKWKLICKIKVYSLYVPSQP